MQFQNQFVVAKKRGVPLVMVESPDPAAAASLIASAVVDAGKDYPIIRWDMVRGIAPINSDATDVIANLCENPVDLRRPDELFEKLPALPSDTILLMYGAEKILSEPYVKQAIWNFRDMFKTNGRMLAMITPLGTKLPADLKDDVIVLEHTLPDENGLRNVVNSLCQDTELTLADETVDKVVDATLGLSEFAAEQVFAMSLTSNGIDLNTLWDRKRKAVEQTQGLTVWKGKENFADIGGLDNAKTFFSALAKGRYAPRVVVFIDEIEKAIGTQQDTSGTSQSMLGTLLSWMEDKDVSGALLVGVPGSGKSAICKSLGNEAGCPTVGFDLSGMKGGIVGSSEQNLRAALATVDAIGQGKVLVLATCNSMANLPPELRRRFKLSTMFFDLPTVTERETIWKLYTTKYNVAGPRPNDTNWTGAEIKTCCQLADRLNISLVEAGKYIVPVAKSGAQQIEKLRREANGSYISASYSGPYSYNQQETEAKPNNGRKLEV